MVIVIFFFIIGDAYISVSVVDVLSFIVEGLREGEVGIKVFE